MFYSSWLQGLVMTLSQDVVDGSMDVWDDIRYMHSLILLWHGFWYFMCVLVIGWQQHT